VSSPGIYDRAAKTVLDIVLRMSKFPPYLVCQHLDDVCAACPGGPHGAHRLAQFEKCYRSVAAELGIKLAPADDTDKGFSVSTSGIVLGVFFDTVKWIWAIPEDKMSRLLHQIETVLAAKAVRQDEIWSLAGRILHYAPLVPTGRFNINYLIKANSVSTTKSHMVEVNRLLSRQLSFWKLLLPCSSGCTSIPDLSPLPAWTIEVWTDAAGGSPDGFRGCGGVAGPMWVFVPWSKTINMGGKAVDGKRLGKKLSALELVGPLAMITADPSRFRRQPVRIWVDNAGSVKIWEKGYSNSCPYCTTLVKALSSVAAALDCRLEIHKIRRCSTPGAVMADAISQGDFRRLRAAAAAANWGLMPTPQPVPLALRRWVCRPRPDDDLGLRLIAELCKHSPFLGYS
jgi:hypothetical protein